MSKVKKVGAKVGKTVGKGAEKVATNVDRAGQAIGRKTVNRPKPGAEYRIGDDITNAGQRKKKGLQVHYIIKVRRVTQLKGLDGRLIQLMYSNGKDYKRNRVLTNTIRIEESIVSFPSHFPAYEFDIILKHHKEPVEEDEVPWKAHPVMFSLRCQRDLSEEDKEKYKIKYEKLLEKANKRKAKYELKGIEVVDEEFDEKLSELKEVVESGRKIDIIGTKVQLDLAQYAEDDLNISEAFGVPVPKPKKKKKDGEEEKEEAEDTNEPPALAYKLIASIQARFVKYMGRRISKDLTIEGDRVMISGEEWVRFISFLFFFNFHPFFFVFFFFQFIFFSTPLPSSSQPFALFHSNINIYLISSSHNGLFFNNYFRQIFACICSLSLFFLLHLSILFVGVLHGFSYLLSLRPRTI